MFFCDQKTDTRIIILHFKCSLTIHGRQVCRLSLLISIIILNGTKILKLTADISNMYTHKAVFRTNTHVK